MEQNLATMRKKLGADAGVVSRPHAKTHKCPAIAKLQLAAGAIGDLHGESQRSRGALRRRRREDPDDDLQRDGEQDSPCDEDSEGEPIVHPGGRQSRGMRRISPTPRRKPASSPTSSSTSRSARARACRQTSGRIALAQLVDKLPNLKLRGMLSYDGGAQHIKGFRKRSEETLKRYEPSVGTFDAMKRSGLNTEIFSGGGTGTYNIMTKVPGMTDVQVGSYIFMDAQYLEIGGEDNEELYHRFRAVADGDDDRS